MPPPPIVSKEADDPIVRLLISSYDDETLMHVQPLLSANGVGAYSDRNQQEVQRISSQNCLLPLTSNGHGGDGESLTREVEHVASETYLVSRLSMTLLCYLG